MPITTALSSLKVAIGIAKGLRSLDNMVAEADVKIKLVELTEALLEDGIQRKS